MATNARTAPKRRPPSRGWLVAAFGEAFAQGWGLPLILFAISAIISVGGLWAWTFSAQHAGALAPLYYFAGGFQFCAQWLANVAMLRARKNRGGVAAGFALLYMIGALLAAGGVYHVAYVAREPGWTAQVDQRIRDRQPYLQAKAQANTTLASANAEILAIAAEGRRLEWPGERVERQSAPSLAIAASAREQIAGADSELRRLPELSPQRPFDWLDAIMVLAALLTAVVEGVGYFGMLGEARAPARASRAKNAEEAKTPSPQGEAKPPPGLGQVLAYYAARKLLGPASAAAMFALPLPAAPARLERSQIDKFDRRDPTDDNVIAIESRREAARVMGKMSGEARRRRSQRSAGAAAVN